MVTEIFAHLCAVQESMAEENTGPAPLFDDTETQAFYQTLPDLRAVVPAVLLGLSDKTDEKDKEKKDDKELEWGEEGSEKVDAEKLPDRGKEEEEEDKDDAPGAIHAMDPLFID